MKISLLAILCVLFLYSCSQKNNIEDDKIISYNFNVSYSLDSDFPIEVEAEIFLFTNDENGKVAFTLEKSIEIELVSIDSEEVEFVEVVNRNIRKVEIESKTHNKELKIGVKYKIPVIQDVGAGVYSEVTHFTFDSHLFPRILGVEKKQFVAPYAVKLTMPKEYTGISGNGMADLIYEDSLKTMRYSCSAEDYPYFIIGKYDVREVVHDGITCNFYIPKSIGVNNVLTDSITSYVSNAIAYFNSVFAIKNLNYFNIAVIKRRGGYCIPNGIALSDFFFTENKNEFRLEKILAHEIAHQWWGFQTDSKALMETLAEYSAALYLSDKYGVQKQSKLYSEYSNKNESEKVGKCNFSKLSSRDKNYQVFIYSKGPLILHHIENKIGKTEMLTKLHLLYQLQRLDLETLLLRFNDNIAIKKELKYYFTGGYSPDYSVSSINGNTIIVKAEHNHFDNIVPIVIRVESGKYIFDTLNISGANTVQNISLNYDEIISEVIIDPNYTLNQYKTSNDIWLKNPEEENEFPKSTHIFNSNKKGFVN